MTFTFSLIATLTSAILAALALLAMQRGWVGTLDGFRAFGLLLVLDFLFGVLALVWLVVALLRSQPWMGNALALVIGVAPLLVIILSLGPARLKLPLVHDIATDAGNPLPLAAAAQHRQPNENSTTFDTGIDIQQQAYPDIAPLQLSQSAQEVYAAVVAEVEAQGWQVLRADGGAMTIEAVAQTPWLKFRDDVVVKVSEEGSGARVDMRSASRVGKGDLGANADRIRHFFAALTLRVEAMR